MSGLNFARHTRTYLHGVPGKDIEHRPTDIALRARRLIAVVVRPYEGVRGLARDLLLDSNGGGCDDASDHSAHVTHTAARTREWYSVVGERRTRRGTLKRYAAWGDGLHELLIRGCGRHEAACKDATARLPGVNRGVFDRFEAHRERWNALLSRGWCVGSTATSLSITAITSWAGRQGPNSGSSFDLRHYRHGVQHLERSMSRIRNSCLFFGQCDAGSAGVLEQGTVTTRRTKSLHSGEGIESAPDPSTRPAASGPAPAQWGDPIPTPCRQVPR